MPGTAVVFLDVVQCFHHETTLSLVAQNCSNESMLLTVDHTRPSCSVSCAYHIMCKLAVCVTHIDHGS
jgi:hypothetical protein